MIKFKLHLITVLAFAANLNNNAFAAPKPIGCLIQPELVAEVGSQVVGVVESVLVERGDAVSKGQVIAILRNNIERASLNVAQSRAKADAETQAAVANLEFTHQRHARNKELFQKKFISAQALEQSAAETEVARQKLLQAQEQQRVSATEVAVARAQLGERTIRSPIDGIITERYVSAGERVEVQPLLRVAKINPLRVEVIMPSALFGSVVTGTEAQISPDFIGAAPVGAKVTLVDKVLDAASGTFRVRLQLPNPDAAIPAGLRCKVTFSNQPVTSNLSKAGNIPASRIEPVNLKLDWALSIPAKAPVRSKM